MGGPETSAADAPGPHACQGQGNTRGDGDRGGGGVPGKAEAFPALRGREGGPRSRGRALGRGHRAPTFGQHLVHRHLVAADAEHPADVPAAGASAAAAAAAGARPGARGTLLPTRVEKLLHLSGGSSRLGRGVMLSSGARAPSFFYFFFLAPGARPRGSAGRWPCGAERRPPEESHLQNQGVGGRDTGVNPAARPGTALPAAPGCPGPPRGTSLRAGGAPMHPAAPAGRPAASPSGSPRGGSRRGPPAGRARDPHRCLTELPAATEPVRDRDRARRRHRPPPAPSAQEMGRHRKCRPPAGAPPPPAR